MRIWAKLSDYYPSDYPAEVTRARYLSVLLHDDSDSGEHFFMARNRYAGAGRYVDLPQTAAFHNLRADGEEHKVMVEVAWNKSMGDSGEAQLVWVVQDNWRSLSDADLAAINKKRDKTIGE